MFRFSLNPIRNIEALKTLVQVGIAWLVLMGFWPMDAEQQALTITFGITIVNFIGSLFEMNQTTPLAEPKAKDGEPLVRASGSMRSASDKRV